MTIQTQKFIRKPLVVEAVQVTRENFEELAAWCHGEIANNDGTVGQDNINPGGQHIRIRVHNPKNQRQTRAYPGDWVLYTEKGYKIYTPKAFSGSFEPMDEPEGGATVTPPPAEPGPILASRPPHEQVEG